MVRTVKVLAYFARSPARYVILRRNWEKMTNVRPIEIMKFFDLLDDCLDFEIEEAKGLDEFCLEDLFKVNSGNNCLHTAISADNSRIEIQTYKTFNRKGEIDVVRGKPELSDTLQEIVDFINANASWMTDPALNNIFVLYSWYRKHCISLWFGEMESFSLSFDNDAVCGNTSDCWIVDCNMTLNKVKKLIWFIDEVDRICGR